MSVRKFKVKREQQFSYFNKFMNKTLTFSPNSNEFVISFSTPPNELESIFDRITLPPELIISVDPLKRYAIIKTGESELESVDSILNTSNEFINFLPSVNDDEGIKRFFIPDELTVQFKKEIGEGTVKQIITSKGSEIVKKQLTPNYFTIAVPDGKGLFETLQEFSSLQEAVFAEPSEVSIDPLDSLEPVNATDFVKQWGLRNNGQEVNGVTGQNNVDINISNAWNITMGSEKVVVAVIDSGIDISHQNLQDNVLIQPQDEDWNFADAESTIPEDSIGHGTSVCGIISAENNSVMIGVAPKCRLLPLKIDSAPGLNQNRVDAINFVSQKAHLNPEMRFIINCSWRVSGNHAGIHSAIINAIEDGHLVITAAGNVLPEGIDLDSTPRYPASYPEAITVAAVDQSGKKAVFSNFGQTVDVCAPGVNIYSASIGSDYDFSNGTSFAAPFVSGLAALIWSHRKDLSNIQVRNLIVDNCRDITNNNIEFEHKLGTGLINAHASILESENV